MYVFPVSVSWSNYILYTCYYNIHNTYIKFFYKYIFNSKTKEKRIPNIK